MLIDGADTRAIAVVRAIRSGDKGALAVCLSEVPGLANARIVSAGAASRREARSLLHIATDWPGHISHGPDIVALLVEAGADVNARFEGAHEETPLHWAASSDDVAILDALLDHGADIEATGGVIDGGTPLADAVAFGQWNAARRLVARGAQTPLWQAAALGLLDRVETHYHHPSPPSREETTNAFWCACHGGQRATAEFLLSQGADVHWVGHDNLTPQEAARRSGAQDLVAWLASHLSMASDT